MHTFHPTQMSLLLLPEIDQSNWCFQKLTKTVGDLKLCVEHAVQVRHRNWQEMPSILLVSVSIISPLLSLCLFL